MAQYLSFGLFMANTPTQLNQKPKPAIRAYLGGSFNPVHDAHIDMAMQVYGSLAPIAAEQQCELQVSLLPNARSPFKQQSTDPKHRLAMLKLAVQGTPLQIEELELWQPPPVYTIDSVQDLRQRYPNDCLIFIMGMDSARSLDKWKQGLALTDYVHLWVFDRSDEKKITANIVIEDAENVKAKLGNKPRAKNIANLSAELPEQLQEQVTSSFTPLLSIPEPWLIDPASPDKLSSEQALKTSFEGRIYIDTRTVKMISSTDIRQQLFEKATQAQNQSKRDANLAIEHNLLLKHLKPAVYHYIIAHQLYSAA